MKTLYNAIKGSGFDRTIMYSDTGITALPVVIFIHGLPFNKLKWNKLIKPLKEDFRVIAYDILGKGMIDDSSTDFSIEIFVEDLLNLMDKLNIAKATICGLSLGGFVAIKAMEIHPERFDSILISDLNTDDSFVTKADGKLAVDNIMKTGVQEYDDQNLKILFSSESLVINIEEISIGWQMILKAVAKAHYNELYKIETKNRIVKKVRVPNMVEFSG